MPVQLTHYRPDVQLTHYKYILTILHFKYRVLTLLKPLFRTRHAFNFDKHFDKHSRATHTHSDPLKVKLKNEL